jgi:hypothetical protein
MKSIDKVRAAYTREIQVANRMAMGGNGATNDLWAQAGTIIAKHLEAQKALVTTRPKSRKR